MDVRDDTTTSNSGLNQSIELFVTANGQLQVTGSHSLHLEVLAGVACELQDLSGQVLENSSRVDGRCGSNTTVRGHSALQKSVDSTHRELYKKGGKAKNSNHPDSRPK